MSASRNRLHPVMLPGDPLERIQASLDVARDLIRLGLHEADDYRIEDALDKAEAAVVQARASVAGAIEAIRDTRDASGGATAAQLRRAFEGGLAARAAERRTNPFEDPLGIDWPGRQAHAAAWNRGRDAWEQRHGIAPAGSLGQDLSMAASRDGSDHRRRILEHQEKIAAERRASGAEPIEPQLKIPLIGEVRRPQPDTPKPRRPRTKKPVQPRLGDA